MHTPPLSFSVPRSVEANSFPRSETRPTLRSRAMAHAEAHDLDTILIKDTGVGTALVTELSDAGLAALPANRTATRLPDGTFEAEPSAPIGIQFPASQN